MARRMGAGHAVERFTRMARADVRALTRHASARDRDLYIARSLDRIGALTARPEAAGEPDESVRLLRRLRAGANIARSEENTSELQSLMRISYAVFCLHKKKNTNERIT